MEWAASGGTLAYARPDPADPTAPWVVRTISEKVAYGHGLGAGDVNGDGRLDILQAAGWWEQPASDTGQEPWRYHPQAFGRWGRSEGAGGAEIVVYDVNGDRLNDVVTGLNAHGWGLAWFEQKRDGNGAISFERHMIMDDYSAKNPGGVAISEMHGAAAADVDGDGFRISSPGSDPDRTLTAIPTPIRTAPLCCTGSGPFGTPGCRGARSSYPSSSTTAPVWVRSFRSSI